MASFLRSSWKAKRGKWMSIQWKDEFSTGVAAIDEQHKKLIEGLNKLQLAMQQGKGNEIINGLLSFLERYAKEHFGFEEKCMLAHKCPVAAANKRAHDEFIARFGSFKSQLDPNNINATLVLKIHNDLSQWIVKHICRVDTQLRACAGVTS